MKRVLFWGLLAPALLRRLVPTWLVESPLLVAARHPWIALAIAGLAVALGGLALAASGITPLSASAGHWTITETLIQFAKRRSVATHSLRTTVPPLDDHRLVLRGAGHYDVGCRPCHGTPRGGRPRVALAMLPAPPALDERVPAWSSAELFYIVKHGLKFTGMPAWPSQHRDDEVWAMIAFLRRLPGMTESEYLALTRGEPETTLDLEPSQESVPDIIRESCARCHGFDGAGRAGAFPILTGQSADYLSRAMHAYASGRRHSGIMSSVVSGLTPQAIDEAAAFYASRPATVPPPPAAAAETPDGSIERGRMIATSGVPARDIPPCAECHGPSPVGTRNPAYPRLAGQHADYLVQQLELLQQRHRGGSEYVHLMHSFVDRLTAQDIRDAAAFFAHGTTD